MRINRCFTSLAACLALASPGLLFAQQAEPRQNNQSGRQPSDARATANPQANSHRQTAANVGQVQGGVPLTQALVQKLHRANQAEIELAKLAEQKSDNAELKQFTAMIIQDHQAFDQKLQQVGSGSSNTTDRVRNTPQAENRQPRDRANAERGSATTESGNANAEQGNASDRETPFRTVGTTEDARAAGRGNRRAMVPRQLTQIMDQACDNSLQMTKDMLQKYEGQDFVMAYLGQQCVAHTMVLAELKAIHSRGPEELKPIVQEAIGKVEKHLEHAKQLAKKFEDKESLQTKSS